MNSRTPLLCLVVASHAFVGCGTGCGGSSQHASTGGPLEHPNPPAPAVAVRAPEPASPAATIALGDRARRVGTNLTPANYYSGAFPLVDLMKATFGWISGTTDAWDGGPALQTDSQGWLSGLGSGQIARVFLLAGDAYHPTGRFTVLYEGRGRIEYNGRVREVERSQGRETFVLDAPDGLYLNITQVDSDDPIRNIRVLAPGGRCESDATQFCESDAACQGRCVPFEETYAEQPFHPVFLHETRPFSVLRFMDWQDTNRERAVPVEEHHPLVEDWDDLPSRDSFSWLPMPVDVMIDLANQLDADPWFSMPHSASDELIAEFAARVAQRLESDRKVYVEYTNEYWNDRFSQHAYINSRGCRAYSDDPTRECDPDGDGTLCEYSEWNRSQERCLGYGRRYFAERSVRIGQIWRAAFSNSNPERVQRVIGTQIGGADWFIDDYLLREIDGQPAHTQLDAVAVAPYFGGGERTFADVDAAFARTTRAQDGAPSGMSRLLAGAPDAEYGDIYHWVRNDVAAIRERLPAGAIDYIAYEGGQHLHSHDESQNTIFQAVNRDPRMEALYTEYLTMWSGLTGDALFVHFTSAGAWSQYGCFAEREYMGQPLNEAPKARALREFVRTAHGG